MSIKNNLPAMANTYGSIRPSNAVIYNVTKAGKITSPVKINEVTVLGTISEFKEKYYTNSNNDEINPGGNNPKTVDSAYLEPNISTFCIKGSIKILSECMSLNVCQNKANADFKTSEMVQKAMNLIKEKGGIQTISKAYASRIASGSFAFRNRYAINPRVEVTVGKALEPIKFECNNEKDFGNCKGLESLSNEISEALSDEFKILILSYKFFGTLNAGGEIYPSQEFAQKNNKGKILFTNPINGFKNAAGIHSQKIGNAIRTIDTWYSNYKNSKRALPIDPYGPDKQEATANRRPGSGESFYDILASLDKLVKRIENGGDIDGKALYFAAMMVRGGVFSGGK